MLRFYQHAKACRLDDCVADGCVLLRDALRHPRKACQASGAHCAMCPMFVAADAHFAAYKSRHDAAKRAGAPFAP